MEVFWEIYKLSQSITFRNIFICVEELNNMKNYLKKMWNQGKWNTLPIFALSAL